MESSGKRVEDCSEDELAAELARRRAQRAPTDMTGVEEAVASHQQHDGRATLQAVLAQRVASQDERPQPCPRCGRAARLRARDRARTIQTVTGTFTFRRHQHYCERCRVGFYPIDVALKLPDEGDVTAYMERRVLDFGLHDTFAQSARRWNVHYAVPISETLVCRVVARVGRRAAACDTGAWHEALRSPPTTPAELVVVQTDGSMLPTRGEQAWHEAKLAVIYRDEHHVAGDATVRGQVTEARYVGVLGSQDEFRPALDTALAVEHAAEAATVAWLGDGAPGNWTLADELCPRAVQILDWMHVTEHASDGGKAVLGDSDPLVAVWQRSIEGRLWEGDVAAVCDELTACLCDATPTQRDALEGLRRYYTTNAARMRYDEFRARGLPIGSGTVESGHRHVYQERMKRAGQHWDLEHARRMVLLRTAAKTAGPERLYAAIQAAVQQTATLRRAA
jgi:hypothetical protein